MDRIAPLAGVRVIDCSGWNGIFGSRLLADGGAEPVGNRHPFAAWAPHGIYPCAGDDRWVAIAVRGDGEWQSLCGVIGESELSMDRRFHSHESRVSNQDALDALLGTWTSGFDRYDVMARCQAAGIAAGAVQDAEDLTGRDPQLADRRFFGSASSETLGDYGIDQFPALFNGVRPPRYEGVHQTGEDTFDVVTAVLGLPDEQFAELAARGVFT